MTLHFRLRFIPNNRDEYRQDNDEATEASSRLSGTAVTATIAAADIASIRAIATPRIQVAVASAAVAVHNRLIEGIHAFGLSAYSVSCSSCLTINGVNFFSS